MQHQISAEKSTANRVNCYSVPHTLTNSNRNCTLLQVMETCLGISMNSLTPLHVKPFTLASLIAFSRDSNVVKRTKLHTCIDKHVHRVTHTKMYTQHTHTHIQTHTHTHTHTHTQPFYGSTDFVRDNPGEPVLEEAFNHSHLSWSSIVPYLLLPSNTIHIKTLLTLILI